MGSRPVVAAALAAAFAGLSSVAADFAFEDKVVRGEARYPVSVVTNAGGRVLVDFGKHAFGWLEVDATAPGEYAFLWGEMLDASGGVQTNAFYTRKEGNIRCACTKDAFAKTGWSRIPYRKGNDSAFNAAPTGRFGTVMPFRWLEIVRAPFEITRANVRQVPVHYPYDMAEESFACDSPALVAVHDFCKHSIRATTYTGKFIDGDRERLPYEADSFITQLSTYAMTSDQTLVRAMADYLATHTTWPTEWKQFFIRIVHADWMHSGRTDLVERHYARMKRDKLWLHLRRADGLLVTRGPTVKPAPDGEKPEDIVDWAMCYRDGFEMCDVNTVVNALHIRNLREMAEMARAIGRTDDAAAFARAAEATFASFQTRLWDPAHARYRDGEGSSHATVQGNAMALACGAVPPDRVRAVADYVASKGFSCSTYMAQFVLDALFAAGRADEAIALLTSDAPRSWRALMAKGATITPEFWDLTMPEPGRIPDMNHAWTASPLNVISRHILGVTPLEPGFAKIAIRPQPGPLKRLSAVVPTVRGAVSLRLRRQSDAWQIELTLPAPAVFSFGGVEKTLPPGHSSFAVDVARPVRSSGVAGEPKCAAADCPYGICAHLSRPGEFETRAAELALMTNSGLRWVRTDFDWKDVEPRAGEWDFARLDRLLNDAARVGVTVLPILDYETPFAKVPWSDESIGLWRRYVRTLVRRYGARCPVWEVWNEQNVPQEAHPHPVPKPEEYARLLKAACEEIKSVDPRLRVAIGGFAGVPLDFIEGVYKAGAQAHFDIMNVHPYQRTARAEERMTAQYRELRALMARYGDAEKPVWATEIGLARYEPRIRAKGLLAKALRTVDPTRVWRILTVENPCGSKMNVRPHLFLPEVLKAELKGTDFTLAGCTFENLRARLASGGFDAVVLPFTEQYPAEALGDLASFVARGGTLVEPGGMAFFRPMVRAADGQWRESGNAAAATRLFRFAQSNGYMDKTLPRWDASLKTGLRFFFPGALKGNDRFVPLREETATDGRKVASVAWIRYDSDWKGNLILGGIREERMLRFDAEEQGIGCARQLNLAFALGYGKVFWYELLTCSEFGIAERKTCAPLPALRAYRAFTAMRPAGSAQTQDAWVSSDGDVYAPSWTRPDGRVAGAVWSLSGKGEAPASVPRDAECRDCLGNVLSALPSPLPDAPVYYIR